MPACVEVLSHIRHGGTLEASARVVPADARTKRMPVRVKAITRLRREVDPTDKRHAVIYNDRLFVMAVHRALVRVECALDLRMSGEIVADLPHLTSRGTEERQRSAGPDQHTDIEALCEIGKKGPKDDLVADALESEAGRKVPSRQVNVRARLPKLLGDGRKGFLAVDENLNGITAPHRRITCSPTSNGGFECALPSETPQAALVMHADLLADLIAEPGLHRQERAPKRAV
jgi:hypothetical protein